MKCGFGPIPEELLHLPRISPSGLSEFRESPAHYLAYINKEKEETAAMQEGTLVHLAILEPEKFHEQYVSEPLKDEFPNALVTADEIKERLKQHGLKTTGVKSELIARLKEVEPAAQIWDEIVESVSKGKIILKNAQWQSLIKINEAVRKREFCSQLFKTKNKEVFCWMLDEENQIVINGKVDLFDVIGQFNVCADVKKVANAHPKKFESDIYYQNHFLKAAVYVDILSNITKTHPDTWRFVWVAVTTKAPFIVQEYGADLGMMEAGRQEYKRLVKEFLKCKKENHFPSYSDKVMNISLPAWAWNKLEDEFTSEL